MTHKSTSIGFTGYEYSNIAMISSLPLLLLVSAACSADVVPSLEVGDGGDIVLTVAEGARVKLKTFDLEGRERSSAIITEEELESILQTRMASLRAELLDQISTKAEAAAHNALVGQVESTTEVRHKGGHAWRGAHKINVLLFSYSSAFS